MIDGEDDQAYRVHLLHGTFGLLWSRLWGKNVGVGDPTYYDGDDVRKRMGRRGWPVEYWDAIRNRKYEVWGQRQDEEAWRPLSRHLVAEQRLAQMIASAIRDGGGMRPAADADAYAAPDPVGRAVELLMDVMQRTLPPPGRGEAAWHLLDHDELRRDHALLAMRKIADWQDISAGDLKRLRTDGKRRMQKGEPCRFCPPAIQQ